MSANISTILTMMERYGGSFVQHLATLYRYGDAVNRQKLEIAFAEYFDEYAELARVHAERHEAQS